MCVGRGVNCDLWQVCSNDRRSWIWTAAFPSQTCLIPGEAPWLLQMEIVSPRNFMIIAYSEIIMCQWGHFVTIASRTCDMCFMRRGDIFGILQGTQSWKYELQMLQFAVSSLVCVVPAGFLVKKTQIATRASRVWAVSHVVETERKKGTISECNRKILPRIFRLV